MLKAEKVRWSLARKPKPGKERYKGVAPEVMVHRIRRYVLKGK